jgi:hypothetical protein
MRPGLPSSCQVACEAAGGEVTTGGGRCCPPTFAVPCRKPMRELLQGDATARRALPHAFHVIRQFFREHPASLAAARLDRLSRALPSLCAGRHARVTLAANDTGSSASKLRVALSATSAARSSLLSGTVRPLRLPLPAPLTSASPAHDVAFRAGQHDPSHHDAS